MNPGSAPLILASASPRRKELLASMGVPFEVIRSTVREHTQQSAPYLSPHALAVENASLKAKAVAKLHPGRWVLGADTVVTLDGRILGKPESIAQAEEFLRALSGRTHGVVTGCALISPEGVELTRHEISCVTFRSLSDAIIARYLAEVPVLDKAGAYALQERAEWIVERVEGSRTNVIGLPTEALGPLFKNRGLL